jgi:CBS domain-containing protein
VPESATILDVARLMMKKKIGAVPVVNSSGRIVGIFTERDLLKRVVAAELDTRKTVVSAVMTRKLVTANADDSPNYCLRKMKEKNFRHMLIAEGKDIIGIVSQRDLIEVDLYTKTRALLSIDA